jgi:hypothetical protein
MILLPAAFAALALVAQDTVYSTPALRDFIARAAVANADVPAEFNRFRVHVESELDFVVRRPDGVETVFYAEQGLREFDWQRDGPQRLTLLSTRQHAARPQMTVGAGGSAVWRIWMMPVLYGERLSMRAPLPERLRRRPDDLDIDDQPLTTLHPLAALREEVYRYSGGDTLVTIRVNNRDVPIARVFVEPRTAPRDTSTRVFWGHIDFDADRHEIVRMTGRLMIIPTPASDFSVDAFGPFAHATFIDLENAEFSGRVWLPATQRFEVQFGAPAFTQSRALLRIVSTYGDYAFNDDTAARRPGDWSAPIGQLTAVAHSDDFQMVAPDAWRSFGLPRAEFSVRTFGEFFRYNRVEGAYTGMGGQVRFRDFSPAAFPDLTLGAAAGYAWSERTVRGRVSADWRYGTWEPSVEIARSLDVTNDFRDPFANGGGFTALIGSADDYDYVDRRSATFAAQRWSANRRAVFRLDAGAAEDRYVGANVSKSPILAGDSGFRPNRGVDEGRYTRAAASVTLNPRVHGLSVATGFGAHARYEVGRGDLAWQRVDVRLAAYTRFGPFVASAKVEGGAVVGDNVPAQQLFEIGGSQHLPGYDYKEFAGDRAAIGRAKLQYYFGIWRRPIDLDRFQLPAPDPALYTSVQSGWTGTRESGTLAAMARFRPDESPILTTGGALTTVAFGLEMFGGYLRFGVARAVDRHEAWRTFPWR